MKHTPEATLGALARERASDRAGPSRDGRANEGMSTRKALTLVYIGYLFRYVYPLVLVPFYGRVLGAHEYGRLLTAVSLCQLVWLLTEYGFPIVGARDTASAAGDVQRVSRLYGQQMAARGLTLIPGLLVGCIGTLLSPVLREMPWTGVLATATGLASAFNLGWHFQGRLRFATSVAMELCGFAISLPMILLLVHGPGDGVLALLSLLTSALVSTVIAHVIALRALDRTAIKLRGGIALVRDATALFAHRGATLLMASSSTYLLSLFASAAQVGWYGAAERLISVGLSLMQPANQVLVGTVAHRISVRETEEAAYRLMRRCLLMLTAFGGLLLASALLLSAPLVPLILGPDFLPTVPMVQVLALIFPLSAFAQVTSSYVLVPLRQDRWVSLSSLFGAVVTFALIIALGWLYGGSGVAWARVAGSFVLAATLLAVLQRQGLLKRILTR